MEPRDMLLPLLGLFGGLLSLYTDAARNRKKTVLVLTFLLMSAVLTVWVNLNDSRGHASQAASDKRRIDDLIQLAKEQKTAAASIAETLKAWGYGGEPLQRVQNSFEANEVRRQVLASVREENEQKPTIEYFPKGVDSEVVTRDLKEAGFPFRLGPAKNDLPTNFVQVGNQVSLADAKFVALTLVRAGVELKAIRRSLDGGGRKSRSIEVGASPRWKAAQTLSVQQISSMTEILPDEF